MKKVIVIFACLFFNACSDKKTESIPQFILPKEKMAGLLLDIHLLEASIGLNSMGTDKVPPGSTIPNFDVLKKNNISKKQYDENFEFYTQHPELLNEVYQLVLNDLSSMQAQVMNKK